MLYMSLKAAAAPNQGTPAIVSFISVHFTDGKTEAHVLGVQSPRDTAVTGDPQSRLCLYWGARCPSPVPFLAATSAPQKDGVYVRSIFLTFGSVRTNFSISKAW